MKRIMLTIIILALAASASQAGTGIGLSWSVATDLKTCGYLVTRSDNGTTYTRVLDVGTSPTVVVRFIEPTDVVKKDGSGRVIGLDDWRLEPATLYLYQVYAYDKRGRMSSAAQTANFTTPVAPPASLTATAKP
jgi:hypothetical protein